MCNLQGTLQVASSPPPLPTPTPPPSLLLEVRIELWWFTSACHGLASPTKRSAASGLFSLLPFVSMCGMGLGEFLRCYLLARGGGCHRAEAGCLLLAECLPCGPVPHSWYEEGSAQAGTRRGTGLLEQEEIWNLKEMSTSERSVAPTQAVRCVTFPGQFPEKLLLSEKLGKGYDFCHRPKILLLVGCRSFHSGPVISSGFPGDVSRFLAPSFNRAEKEIKE